MKVPTQESRLTLKPGYRFSRMRLCPGRASELPLQKTGRSLLPMAVAQLEGNRP